MNIYLISRISDWGYDDYGEAVVIAVNETEAKCFHPNEQEYFDIKENTWKYIKDKSVSCEDKDAFCWTSIDDIEVKKIGTAPNGSKKGVVLSSFYAG